MKAGLEKVSDVRPCTHHCRGSKQERICVNKMCVGVVGGRKGEGQGKGAGL